MLADVKNKYRKIRH